MDPARPSRATFYPCNHASLFFPSKSVPHFRHTIRRSPVPDDRYIKVKMQNMTKQLQDGAELKIKMEEQIKDLQKQLNNAREENRNLTKRY